MIRLVLIDSDVAYATSLRQHLELVGFEVCWGSDAAAGWALIQRTEPDLVLLEAALPGLPGYSVLRRLQERSSSLPVVVLTVLADDVHKMQALELGAADYITKPVAIGVLLARVFAILRRALPRSNLTGPSYDVPTRYSPRSASTCLLYTSPSPRD